MTQPHIVILGAGPAGLGAAFQLARRKLARVSVLERNNRVGGNAGSFELAGMQVDYGSHRLHPACDPSVLADIRGLIGSDLLDRPRHGRIRLCGQWIHFPLKPLDLMLRLPPRFSAGVATDILSKPFGNGAGVDPGETFASLLERGLGRTICHDFYFPYVQKIWGLKPKELSVTLARRRVSGNSLSKMTRKILSAVPGFKAEGRGRFFYPRFGFGQIAEAYGRAARDAGAEIQLGAGVGSVEVERGAVRAVSYEQDGRTLEVDANHVWSTIPITILTKCLKPAVPAESLRAADSITYRAMILIYLVLEQRHFSEFDAHYFPEPSIPISRLSEPKNYAAREDPEQLTVLCAELPCAPEGAEWKMSDDELGRLTCSALEASGIPVRAPIKQVVTQRLRQAYPIYHAGYENYFDALDRQLNQVDGLLTFGRQGLFAHDNTHHALYMAYCAVECIDADGRFDSEKWRSYRQVFESHVVED